MAMGKTSLMGMEVHFPHSLTLFACLSVNLFPHIPYAVDLSKLAFA